MGDTLYGGLPVMDWDTVPKGSTVLIYENSIVPSRCWCEYEYQGRDDQFEGALRFFDYSNPVDAPYFLIREKDILAAMLLIKVGVGDA